MSGRIGKDADRATHEPSQSSLSQPSGECPLRKAQQARADGLRKWFANPANRAAHAEKIRAAQLALWTPERKAWMSQLAKEKIASGEWKRGHTAETRERIGAISRKRYAEAKAQWIAAGGKLELVGDIRWARIDWPLARELQAEGASIDDLATFFASQRRVIRRGLKHGN